MKSAFLFFCLSLFTYSAFADIQVRIISPSPEATVTNPVNVIFQVNGIATQELAKEGHLHLVIDKPLPQQGEMIPVNPNYLHLSATQTQVELELSPGEHSLQLLLGSHHHTPHPDNIHSERVVIIVTE